MPQAVARAVARSCVDVSRLQPTLLRALLLLLILQVLEKLGFSGSDFGRLKIPSPCHAHASSSCSRGCAQLRGCAAVAAQVAARIVVNLAGASVRRTLMFRFRFWEPEQDPNPCHAHASSSCARGCAQLCGCVTVAGQVAARIVVNFAVANVRNTLIVRFRFWELEKLPNPYHAHASRSCARGCAQLCGRIAAAAKVAARIAVTFDFASVRKTWMRGFRFW